MDKDWIVKARYQKLEQSDHVGGVDGTARMNTNRRRRARSPRHAIPAPCGSWSGSSPTLMLNAVFRRCGHSTVTGSFVAAERDPGVEQLDPLPRDDEVAEQVGDRPSTPRDQRRGAPKKPLASLGTSPSRMRASSRSRRRPLEGRPFRAARQPLDQAWRGLISRIGFRAVEAARAAGSSQRPVGAVLGGDEADGALRQPVGGAHIGDFVAQRQLGEGDETRRRRGLRLRRLRACRRSGIAARSAAPCVTDLNGLPSKPAPRSPRSCRPGSGSSSTSMPRARKPSSCGEVSSRSRSSPAM